MDFSVQDECTVWNLNFQCATSTPIHVTIRVLGCSNHRPRRPSFYKILLWLFENLAYMTTVCLTFTARMETVQWWCTKAPSYKAYQLHGTISVADKLRKVQGTQHLNAQFFSSPWFFSELLLRLSDDAIFASDCGTIGHFLFLYLLFLPHLDQLLTVGQLATFFSTTGS